MNFNTHPGTVIGGVLGFLNGTIIYISIYGVTLETLVSTGILALFGSLVGFLGNEMWKYLKKKYLKRIIDND